MQRLRQMVRIGLRPFRPHRPQRTRHRAGLDLTELRKHCVAQPCPPRLNCRRLGLLQQRGTDGLRFAQALPAVRALFQMRTGDDAQGRRQGASGIAHQRRLMQMVVRIHDAPPTFDCNCRNARRRCDLTVPSGMPSACAISLWLLASK
ncbi:hypothetical protein D3C73_903790 [compost metagenome]